jgi:hypothetical protein
LVVTEDGCEVITRFPAEELMVTGLKYHTATGPLSGIREQQSNRNNDYTGVNYGGAGLPDGADGNKRANGRKTAKKATKSARRRA